MLKIRRQGADNFVGMLSTPLGRSGLTLALILVTLLSAAAPGGMASATSSSEVATLLVLSGSVMVSGVNGVAPATDGQTVQVGDEVWTGSDGTALLTFFDGSETQIQADSRITLEVPPGATPGTSVSVFQSAGTTLTHVQHLAPNASFQTDTPAAVAMVRGTTYVVTVMPQSNDALDSEQAQASQTDVPDTTPGAAAETIDGFASVAPAADMPADDNTDQQAALVVAAPLLEASAAMLPDSCRRERPTDCVASVVLLADVDGHVGHVEVASHIAGHPTLHLTAHGDAAHVSRMGAAQHVVPSEHLKSLHAAAANLLDAQRAHVAHVAARHVARVGNRLKPPAPPTQAH